ncbi:MAG TPA: histidine kinase N-terminal 7TM domain-containing protein, partial [Anaerolinea sp.]|nr:histidine kinase N-terminal 7TM domain-containing protein [Anaerolinea sp.]
VGVVAVPTSFLAFALVFTQRMPRIPRHARAWLAIEPLLTVALLWTDPWHGLFFGGVRSAEPGAILSGGVWFWVNVVYSYGLVLATLVILVQALLRAPRFQRLQVS